MTECALLKVVCIVLKTYSHCLSGWSNQPESEKSIP